MRDKRPVDELSIEELERVLAIRKREERQRQLQRMQRSGRVMTAQENGEKPKNTPLVVSEKPKNSDTGPIPAPQTVPTTASQSTPQPTVTPRFDDEFDEDYTAPRKEDNNRIWRAFVNRSLLLVEVLAVVGLVLLGVNLFDAITKLEEETADAASAADEIRRAGIPTLEPTPILMLEQYVLPGGHIRVAGGSPQFNFNEVPQFLLTTVQSQINQPELIYRPPATSETARIISIPRLNLDVTIVAGVDWEALKSGVGQLINGVNPGDPTGNVVLAAHNDIYGEYFRYLDTMQLGDQFTIQTDTQAYTYTVTGTDIVVRPTWKVMDNRDGATVTLISCYPYGENTHRYIVYANRDAS
ncbi:MAG: class D sortase [Anaerolineae bacterium]